MTSTVKIGTLIIGGFLAFIMFSALRAPDPMTDPAFAAQVNQTLLQDCLKADRARIALYGEAKPTEDCRVRELAYAQVTK